MSAPKPRSEEAPMSDEKGHFNRAARRSGGNRRTVIPIDRTDATLLLQEALIRKEFGEEGVKGNVPEGFTNG